MNSISLGFSEPDDMEVTLSTLMMRVVNEEELHIEDAVLHHEEGVDIIPSNIELSALEISMVNVMSRETILRQLLVAVERYNTGRINNLVYASFSNIRKNYIDTVSISDYNSN